MTRTPILATAITLGWLSAANAADHTLIISTWAPPTHVTNAEMWPRLVEMIEEATDGRVTAEIKYDLAPPPAQADVVLDGAADLTYIFHGYNPGRFVGSTLIELPGYEGDAAAASAAYWHVHEEFLAPLNEHRGFKLVGLFTHGPAQLHTSEPIEGLGAVAELKVRMPGGVGTAMGEGLGAISIQVPAPRVYETLSSGAADGVLMNMDSRTGFRLTEVAPHVFEVPGGFYRGSFAILMNEDTFERFPDDVRAALEENVFGEPASRMFGEIWDGGDARARETTAGSDDNTITAASAGDLERFGKVVATVTDRVLASLTERGVDAEAAHAFVKDAMAQDMADR